MKKLFFLLLMSSTCSAAFIPNVGPLSKLDVDGSTRTVGYQGAISSVPVSVQGTANAQVVTSTLQVTGSVEVLTSTLQVQVGNTVPVSGTFFQTTQPISGSVSGSGPYSVTAGTGAFTLGFVGATGSTVSASYQGATISSFPVAIQGTASVQVLTSTLQVSGGMEVLTSTLQVSGGVEVLTSTLQVSGGISVLTSTLQVQVGNTPSVNLSQVGATTVLTGGVNGSQGIGGLAASGAAAAGNPIQSGLRVTSTTIPTAASDGQEIYQASDNIGRALVTGMPWGLILSTYATVMSSNGVATQSAGGQVFISSSGANTRIYLCGITFTNTTATANEAVLTSPPNSIGNVAKTQFIGIPASFVSSGKGHDCANPFFASAINSSIGIYQSQTAGAAAAIHYHATYFIGP